VVSESHVTLATSVPILIFLGLSVLELGPMYATDRRQTKASLNACGGGITKLSFLYFQRAVKIRWKVGKIVAAIDLTELVFGWGFAPYSAREVMALSG